MSCFCSRRTIRTGSSSGDEVLPSGLSEVVLQKILCGNAQATYPRLAETNSAMEVNA